MRLCDYIFLILFSPCIFYSSQITHQRNAQYFTLYSLCILYGCEMNVVYEPPEDVKAETYVGVE